MNNQYLLMDERGEEKRETLFPQDLENPYIIDLINKHKGERPYGLRGGRIEVGLIIWSFVVAGTIPASVYYSYVKNGIKGIPKGVLNGIIATTCWSIYVPSVVTMVFGQIPIGIVDFMTFKKMKLMSRTRESMYSSLYGLDDMIHKTTFCEE